MTNEILNGAERPPLTLPQAGPAEPWGTPPAEDTPPVPVEQAGGVLHAGDRTDPDTGRPVEGHLIRRRPDPKSRIEILDSDDPILPGWLRHPRLLVALLWTWRRRAWRASLLGLKHSPRAVRLTAWWFLRGMFRLAHKVMRWAWDVDGSPIYGAQPAASDKAFDHMTRNRSRRQTFRFELLAGMLGGLGVAALVAFLLAAVMFWTITVVIVVVLCWYGKPPEAKILSPGVRAFVRPLLTCDLVAKALAEVVSKDVAKAIRDHPERLWHSGFEPIYDARKREIGHRIDVALPGSAIARDLIPHEQRLANMLSRPEDCVVIEPQPRLTPGHFRLYALEQPVLGAVVAGPLATAKRTSWWAPVAIGSTRTAGVHHERLLGGAWLIAGKPNFGKSTLGLLAGAHTALDPGALLMLANLKGSADWAGLMPACHTYISASPESDPAVRAKVKAMTQWLLDETGRRNEFLTDLVRRKVIDHSDGVTEELAKKYPQDLGPITVIIDEAHRMFEEDKKGSYAQLLAALLRACRSVAISVILITQLGDKDSIPTILPGIARLRACFAVNRATSFSQVYGNAGEGVFNDLGIIRMPPGVAIVSTDSGIPQKIGTYLIKTHLVRIGERGRDMRERAGLSALPKAPAVADIGAQIDLLRAVLRVIPATDPTDQAGDSSLAWIACVEEFLSRDQAYAGRSQGWLRGELRGLGVPTDERVNRRRSIDPDEGSGQRHWQVVRSIDVRSALDRILGEDEEE